MKRLLMILLVLVPCLVSAGTQVFAPFFIVGGVLKADSLAARALTITSAINVPNLTINSAYRFGRATGTNGQILALDTESTPDSTYWTAFTMDSTALITRNVGSGYTYVANTTDRFGVGTNSPSARFSVEGGSTIFNDGSGDYDFRIESDGDANCFVLDGGLNSVGIGTLSPAQKLHVRMGGLLVDSTNAAWIYVCSETDASSYTADAGIRFGHRTPTNTDGAWRLYKTDRYEANWDLIGSLPVNFFNSKYSTGTSTFIFNNDAINMDVTIKGDTDAALLVTDGSADRVGIGTTAPDKKVEINSATGACLRLTYNDNNGSATNYSDFAVSSGGDLTITPSGGDLNVAGVLGVNDATHAGTYDIEVGDSVQVAGNLLLGTYGGAYSYVHPGQTGFTASSTRDIKVVGPEKKVNVLPLIKSLPVYEWQFDADKIKDKFKEPAGFDTLSVAIQDSIRTDFLSNAARKAANIAKERHVSPLAEDWYAISQHFGGNPKEISSEHVTWALMLAVKQLNARCDSLESRIKALEVTRTMPIEVKDE